MNRFKELRIDNDLTMKQVSDYLGIKYQQYQRYENNVTPKVDIYVLLSKYYSVSVDYLLNLTDVQKPYPRSK